MVWRDVSVGGGGGVVEEVRPVVSQHANQMHQPRTLQLHGCGATLNCLR